MFHEIIIIGAGASGLISAITATENGKDTAILESNQRVGKKLLSTGNGRCNITNGNMSSAKYHSSNKEFFKDVFKQFNCKDTIEFFNSLGLPIIELEDGKMYPMSLQASSVLDILRMAIEDRNIPVYNNCKAKDIIKIKNGFKIVCNNEIFKCHKLIICTGGKSAPNTGSDGSGYSLSLKLGHNIIPPVPSLVQLKLKYENLKALSGTKFNGSCEILIDGKCQRKEYGEILFTDYGISGPPILQISGKASRALHNNRNVTVKIDMFPQMDNKVFIEFIENHWGILSYRSVYDSFIGIINKKLIPIILKEAHLDNIHKLLTELTWQERQNIFHLLKSWEFSVYDTNSFKNSQVTSGGIDTKEIDSKTLESKKIKNLYFAGEILDVDGDCGGFNLQWCWSSGFVCGKNASI